MKVTAAKATTTTGPTTTTTTTSGAFQNVVTVCSSHLSHAINVTTRLNKVEMTPTTTTKTTVAKIFFFLFLHSQHWRKCFFMRFSCVHLEILYGKYGFLLCHQCKHYIASLPSTSKPFKNTLLCILLTLAVTVFRSLKNI